ncbi:hypothetical protein RYX56_21980, partial [Alkalihalophilus lindianensis]|nr:hypothetical protein [Alkalihalophilus lindianensis]
YTRYRPGMERSIPLDKLALRLKELAGDVTVNPYLLFCTYEVYRLVFFKDGRALIHGTSEPAQAKAIYHRIVGLKNFEEL